MVYATSVDTIDELIQRIENETVVNKYGINPEFLNVFDF